MTQLHTRGGALLFVAAFVAILAVAPTSSSAQVEYRGPDLDGAATALAIGIGVLGAGYLTVDAILIGEAVDKACTHGHGLYEGGAIFELVWGGLHLAALGIPIVVLATSGENLDANLTANLVASGVLATAGGWFVGHALWSLTTGHPNVHRTEPPVRVAAVPTNGGALASLSFQW